MHIYLRKENYSLNKQWRNVAKLNEKRRFMVLCYYAVPWLIDLCASRVFQVIHESCYLRQDTDILQ